MIEFLAEGALVDAGVSLVTFLLLLVVAFVLLLLGTQALKWSGVLSAKAEEAKQRVQAAPLAPFIRDGMREGLNYARTEVDEASDDAIVYATETIQAMLRLARLNPNLVKREQVSSFATKLIDELLEAVSQPIAPPPDKV